MAHRHWSVMNPGWPRFSPNYLLVLVALLAVVVMTVFKLAPAAIAVVASLTDARLLGSSWVFVGFEQYARLLVDPRFWAALGISLVYSFLIVILASVSGLLLAAALRSGDTWSWLLRIAFLVPAVMPSMVVATVWMRLFDPTFGAVNQVLSGVGIAGPNWLHDPQWALATLVLLGAWREVGLAALLFSAGLSRIPADVEAAAVCDGADSFRTWRYVTLPLLRPAAALVVVTTGLRCFEHFTPFFAITGGGPAGATMSWTLFLYATGFERYDVGYAASAAVVVSLGLAVLLGMGWRQSRRAWGEAV